jgi:hypothetical protein
MQEWIQLKDAFGHSHYLETKKDIGYKRVREFIIHFQIVESDTKVPDSLWALHYCKTLKLQSIYDTKKRSFVTSLPHLGSLSRKNRIDYFPILEAAFYYSSEHRKLIIPSFIKDYYQYVREDGTTILVPSEFLTQCLKIVPTKNIPLYILEFAFHLKK